ncbi:MAG: hypothetical protein ACOH1O_05405 [Flavobacterium sp.]
MTRKFTFVILLLLMMFSCFGQQNLIFGNVDHYKTAKFDSAIFPADYIDLIPGVRFTPTREEVDKAEIALALNIKKLNKNLINQTETPFIHKKLHKYKRQYFGYTDNDVSRILLINFFWSKDRYSNSNNSLWLKERILVFDGGSYYWNIRFDLEKNQLFDLDINGYG